MYCGVGHLGFVIDTNNFPLLSPFNDYSCIEFLVSYKKNSFISPHGSMLNLTCGGGHLGYPLDTNNIFKGPSNNYSHTNFLVSENKLIFLKLCPVMATHHGYQSNKQKLKKYF